MNENYAWRGFKKGLWNEKIDVRDFIQTNFVPYTGNDEFLSSATERTITLKDKFSQLLKKEQENGGVLDIDTQTVSSLCNYAPGYLDKENEIIVGLQTDAPLRRGVNPFGGIRMARAACTAYGYTLSEKVEQEFQYRTTHNDGVFRVYSDEMKALRRAGIITGLPDAYGRGRIIGDYRRVPLYGVDFLISEKLNDKKLLSEQTMTVDNIRLSEELYQQIHFLELLKEMAKSYGEEYDISRAANNAREAVQWLYFAYLAAIKEQNGAAMSLGRVSTFIDIYIERDIAEGTLNESNAQELIDQLVLKLRMARHLRTPEYNELFAGDPMWITESLGGIGEDGRPLVTKNTYRFIHTLTNLGTSPEPNLTVLWSDSLPKPFKEYAARMSIGTKPDKDFEGEAFGNALQYENDDLMRPIYGDDYGIACCVSAMKIGKQMQFFGARCNLPKLLLLTLNGGRNETDGEQIAPTVSLTDESDLCNNDGYLDFDKVKKRFDSYREWLCRLYVNTMNIIHYMHDKYAYEKLQMALHDTEVKRFMAFGVAGLSVAADSLSAIKYTKVKALKNDIGLIYDFETDGTFPSFGNDDDRVDSMAAELLSEMSEELRKNPAYRESEHTLSALTITSNVVYGKKTGATPDGRKAGEPFAPGANPMHNRETNGALASLNSVAKLPYGCCRDGISNTFSIVPDALGRNLKERTENLCDILDGYFSQNAHHINVNVLDKDKLLDAMEHPELYPNLTIRVSGYAVHFHKLDREHQLEVISRTFHSHV